MSISKANHLLRVFVVVAVVVLIAGVGYLLLRVSNNETLGVPSYHFIASLDVQQPSDGGKQPPDAVEAWYEPGKGLRWNLSYDDAAKSGMGTQLVLTPDGFLHYDGNSNTYTNYPVPEGAQDYPGTMIAASIQLGPLPATDLASYFDNWRGATWQVTREEQMLGMKVQVVEVGQADGGQSTYWIEPKHLFVVRYESGSGNLTISARIDELELDGPIDDGWFTWVAPANAREVEPASSSSSSSGSSSSGLIGTSSVIAPEGFLTPAYVPAGYVTRGYGSTESNGRTTNHRISLSLGSDQPATLFIEQQFRAGGLQGPISQATSIDVSGQEGYRTTYGREETIIWSVGDVVVTLRTTALPFSELLRIAESMS